MPLEPPLAGSIYATDFASSNARLKASTVLTSGLGAPSLTTTPIPTLARLTRVPGATLPEPASSSRTAGVITATSNASPPSIRFLRPPAVSLSSTTLMPVCFSKSGTKAKTTCLKAPAVSTFTSAAETEDVRPKRQTVTIRANQIREGMRLSPKRWKNNLHDLCPFQPPDRIIVRCSKNVLLPHDLEG